MTPYEYALECFKAGSHPMMPISEAAGSFWIHNSDWQPLKTKLCNSIEAAEKMRSSALARALKKHFA